MTKAKAKAAVKRPVLKQPVVVPSPTKKVTLAKVTAFEDTDLEEITGYKPPPEEVLPPEPAPLPPPEPTGDPHRDEIAARQAIVAEDSAAALDHAHAVRLLQDQCRHPVTRELVP